VDDLLKEYPSNIAQRRPMRKGGQKNPDRDAGQGVYLQHSIPPDYISQLIIEEERQRQLSEGIKESQEFIGAVVRSPIRKSWRFKAIISDGIAIFRSRALSLRIQRPRLPRIV
jgi:hypothetical protein